MDPNTEHRLRVLASGLQGSDLHSPNLMLGVYEGLPGDLPENVISQLIRLGQSLAGPDDIIRKNPGEARADRIGIAVDFLVGDRVQDVTPEVREMADGIVLEIEQEPELKQIATPGHDARLYHDGLIALQSFAEGRDLIRGLGGFEEFDQFVTDHGLQAVHDLIKKQQDPNSVLNQEEMNFLESAGNYARLTGTVGLDQLHEQMGHRWVERNEDGTMSAYERAPLQIDPNIPLGPRPTTPSI